jgi:tRNA dimethylallyltransferase
MEELGLEYRYLARFLQGKITRPEMIDRLYREIVKYSKRQMTWFKRDKKIKWFRL